MLRDTITFQLPTHYLPKIALRLEYLFRTIENACKESHAIVHHYALNNIIEMINLAEKPELKSRFLKEFVRIEHAVNKSQTTLSNTLYANLFLQIQHLNHVSGRFGEPLQTDPFLQNIRASKTLSHNDCELLSPPLQLWLEHDAEQRRQDLTRWLSHLRSLNEAVNVYLSLLRNTAEYHKIQLHRGYYQCALPSKTSCHLILLRMKRTMGLAPRIELGHHGLSLRLCEERSISDPYHTTNPIDLALCQL